MFVGVVRMGVHTWWLGRGRRAVVLAAAVGSACAAAAVRRTLANPPGYVTRQPPTTRNATITHSRNVIGSYRKVGRLDSEARNEPKPSRLCELIMLRGRLSRLSYEMF